MSNPAVIKLAEINTQIGNFKIEDNIGEAIHIHLGEIRYDLTIEEFINFATDIGKALEGFLDINNFRIEEFSAEFLFQKAELLPDLRIIKHDVVRLSDLIVDVESKLFGFVFKKLPDSRVVKALNGYPEENNRRLERNYYDQTNQSRLDEMLDSISKFGYPYKGKKIVLFNDQNHIFDGQHRAGCLYYLNGDMEVPIVRMCFENNLYSASYHPIRDRLFNWNRKRIRGLLRKAKQKLKEIKYIIKCKKLSLYLKIDHVKYR